MPIGSAPPFPQWLHDHLSHHVFIQNKISLTQVGPHSSLINGKYVKNKKFNKYVEEILQNGIV